MTPGNWIAIPKGDWCYIHSGDDESCIAVVTPKGTNEETITNANVLAASKDLLEALNYMMSIIESIPEHYLQLFEDEILGEIIDFGRVQLAIAKAKGEGGRRQCGTITTE